MLIDYAERWSLERLERMISSLASDGRTQKLRVLLLARDGMAWWEFITSSLYREVDHFSDPIQLGDFIAAGPGAISAFEQATAAFQAALNIPPARLNAPPGLGDGSRSPLGLHMAALAAVLARRDQQAPPSAAKISDFLLGHERRYWSLGLGAGLPGLEAATQLERISKVLLIATLFGPFENPEDARYLVRAAHLADSDLSAQYLIDQHSNLYPSEQVEGAGDRYLQPLYPDLLAEHFVSVCLKKPSHRALVIDLFRAVTSMGWVRLQRRALSLLAAVVADSQDYRKFGDLVTDLLRPGASPTPWLQAYVHLNSKGVPYFLHRTEVTLRDGKPQTIYFFAKVPVNAQGEPTPLPEDRVVKENPRNGFLTVSKKKQ